MVPLGYVPPVAIEWPNNLFLTVKPILVSILYDTIHKYCLQNSNFP